MSILQFFVLFVAEEIKPDAAKAKNFNVEYPGVYQIP
jgi:hypothetical protein